MVAVEVNHARRFGDRRGAQHAGAGDGGGFRAFLIDLDHGILLHETEPEGIGRHRLEVRHGAERARHAHVAEDVVELDVVFRLKGREPEVDQCAACHLVAQRFPFFAIQRGDQFGNRMAFLREQDDHRIGAVAVGQADCLADVVLAVGELALLLHHPDFFFLAGFKREGPFPRIALVERVHPTPLEIEGVEQIGKHVGVHVVEHRRNQAVGLPAAPAVDGPERRLLLGEVEACHFGVVKLFYPFLVRRLDSHLAVEENGVGQGQFRPLVEAGQCRQHLAAVGIDGLRLAGRIAEGAADFIGSRPVGTVQDQSEQILEADR